VPREIGGDQAAAGLRLGPRLDGRGLSLGEHEGPALDARAGEGLRQRLRLGHQDRGGGGRRRRAARPQREPDRRGA